MLLDLCGFMLESHLEVRKPIYGMERGDTYDMSLFILLKRYGFTCLHVPEDFVFLGVDIDPHLTMLVGRIEGYFE